MDDIFKGIITADGKKRQLPYGSVLEAPVSDETLSIQGGFADAKVVGAKFEKVKAEAASLKEDKVGAYLTITSSISIHVPSWGTTAMNDPELDEQAFQSTFPRGERQQTTGR